VGQRLGRESTGTTDEGISRLGSVNGVQKRLVNLIVRHHSRGRMILNMDDIGGFGIINIDDFRSTLHIEGNIVLTTPVRGKHCERR
jgi:hypothetical protein